VLQDEAGAPSPSPNSPVAAVVAVPKKLHGLEEVEGLEGQYASLVIPPDIVAAVSGVQAVRKGLPAPGARAVEGGGASVRWPVRVVAWQLLVVVFALPTKAPSTRGRCGIRARLRTLTTALEDHTRQPQPLEAQGAYYRMALGGRLPRAPSPVSTSSVWL
jgi:hypothetical protein